MLVQHFPQRLPITSGVGSAGDNLFPVNQGALTMDSRNSERIVGSPQGRRRLVLKDESPFDQGGAQEKAAHDATQPRPGKRAQSEIDVAAVLGPPPGLDDFLKPDPDPDPEPGPKPQPQPIPQFQQAAPRETWDYKVWYVLLPVIYWPVIGWIMGIALVLAGVLVSAAWYTSGGKVEPTGQEWAEYEAVAQMVAPYIHYGLYFGLLIGLLVALKRMTVSREALWVKRWEKRNRRR